MGRPKMKALIFILVISPIFSENFDVSTSKHGIAQLLVKHFHSEDLSLHGCICGNYVNRYFPQGNPIDTVDTICNRWRRARNCLELSSGSCHGTETTYDFSADCTDLTDS